MGFKHFSLVEREYQYNVDDDEGQSDSFSVYEYEYDYHPGKIAKPTSSGYLSDVSLFPGEKEPEKGDDIYVTVVTYSTGDSFSQVHGKKHFVWAFTDENNAKELEKAIENRQKSFKGIPIEDYMWTGYFDSLDSVDVEKFTVS